ncbi:heparinase II/III family protein [Kaistia dalseonensis]|uniref:Heparinase superfamily protein n=1 Tax=Kaistia dalseonensis TaxID=410840 RepID=A0ABU0H4P3_9HYPH|nr:heparinase II/III family protein [Kaistia dalseonensis]MCX5494702.1 heparinase II/III family protein [Kaistia dalseonensis]MDQ0437283.1 putative heparinase superfamily protein [Kaistia dalseonensis]
MALRAGSGRGRLFRFVLASAWRRARYAFHAGAFYRWRYFGQIPDRLLIAPTDLRTADPTIAHDIYAGRFVFAGDVVDVSGFSVFEIEAPSPEWAAGLHGFGWLRHLRASDLAVSRSNARSLVDEWIKFQKNHDPMARDPQVMARRIISWLAQTPLILEGCDHAFYRRFMRSLTKQVRQLRRIAPDVRPGLPRLHVVTALSAAGLSLSDQTRFVRQASRWLDRELARQVLPDGGHVGRNPGAVLEILVDLLPLRQAFTARGLQPTPALLGAIDRMMPMLRFFRHGDGSFAKFNGMGDTELGLLATVLAYDDARGAPVRNAPYAGYQRLDAGDTVVLTDTGAPPAPGLSLEAHAGCLSFEMSAGRHPIVVNCGVPARGNLALRRLARTTAAHSTVTLNDSSSCRFLTGSLLSRRIGEVIVSGPQRVELSRQEERGETVITAAHDGYVSRFGIRHERRLTLSRYGDVLDGMDSFTSPTGAAVARGGKDSFAIRFHLHPAVKASRIKGGHAVLLALPDGSAWEFETNGHDAMIEESIRLSDIRGSRRAEQIVVYGRALHQASVRWRFRRVSEAGGRRRNDDEGTAELPFGG